MTDEPYQLGNDPPPRRPLKPESRDRQKQQTLFAGLDCLPGQQDLFPTDGNAASENTPSRAEIADALLDYWLGRGRFANRRPWEGPSDAASKNEP